MSTEGGSGETVPLHRVQRFVERYQTLHEHHVGVAYVGNPQKDYQAACELVAVFDDTLLDEIAIAGLTDSDPFMAKGTRTLTKLRSRASGYAQHLTQKPSPAPCAVPTADATDACLATMRAARA